MWPGGASYYTYAVHAVSVLGTILWRKGRDVCLNLHPQQCVWNSQKKSWAISMSSNNRCNAKSDACRRSRTSKMNDGVIGHDRKFHLWSSHKGLLTVLHMGLHTTTISVSQVWCKHRRRLNFQSLKTFYSEAELLWKEESCHCLW